ncbi:hypothetical protein [Bacillus sp. TH19]|uniref:hypothetical protein n=1 Tax=Bacillus sp. TH19 TaxID=2796385 RepID=UPI001F5BA144|nr:hypothetical protein [Bacillus sp. TH19]
MHNAIRKSCSFIRATLFLFNFKIYNKSIKQKGEILMAYNFVTDEHYNVNFDELEIMLKEKSLLNFQYQNEWLNSWLEILKKADQDTDIQIQNKNKHNLSFEGFEIFQKEVIFPSFSFYFNFVITGAHLFIEKTNPKIQTISLKNIHNKSFPLEWSPTDNWRKSVNNQKPIIYTRFPLGMNEYLLIDGNHRLTAKINTRQNSIKSYIISPQEIVDHKILPTTIDATMYLFIIESANFSKALSENKYTDQQIFDSSLIHSAFTELLK